MGRQIRGIHMHDEMEGSGSALLLLHGFTGSLRSWDPFVAKWGKTHQIVRPDLLGHGETDSPLDGARYRIEELAQDLIELLNQHQIDKVHVLGYSMGGRLALSLGALYPERINSLILESASPGLKTLEERQARIQADEALAKRIELEGIAAFVTHWERLPLFATQESLTEETRQRIRALRLQNSAAGLAGSLRGMGTGAQPSWWDVLEKFEFPVLLLTGEIDVKFCGIAAEMKKLLPNAKHQIVPHAGHTLHVEQPQIFGTIVEDWLCKKCR